MRLHHETNYSFDRAGVYEIHVVGNVDERMLEYLPGITRICHEDNDDLDMNDADMDVTVLTGWLPDQAALNGVLNTLYDRHYTLALVRRMPRRADDGEFTA